MRPFLWCTLSWVLAACGGVTQVDEPCLEDATAPVVTDAGITLNPDCLETDQTIEACAAADAPSSWTAPSACFAIREALRKAWPQKRKADGSIVQRTSTSCCKVYPARDGGVEALCCADLAACLVDK